jgi:phage-related minor tail protein
MSRVISSLNGVASRIDALDKALARQASVAEGGLRKEKEEREQAAKKQVEDLEKLKKTTQEILQEAELRSEIGQIRNHLLKTKIDLTSRNIGTAKNDLRNVQRALEKFSSKVPEAVKPTVEEAKENVKKAASDVDTDLGAASDRINIAWRELDKLVPMK